MTAKLSGLIRADGSAVNVWDLGSGRVDLTKAALSGLVLDETTANFLAANPASSGVLATLNLAEFTSANCATTCVFTRAMHSTALASQTYSISISGLPVDSAVPTTTSFTIAAGDTQPFGMTIDGSGFAAGWTYGAVELTPDNPLLPTLHMPIAIHR
jgi:hypothetical protein